MSAGRNVEARQLADQVLALLKLRPMTIKELSDELGFSHHAIRTRLIALMIAGHIHFVEIVTKGGLGKAKLWCIGAAATDQLEALLDVERERALLEQSGSISVPRQATQHVYPAINRRDPLVAALFGPARQVAA